MKYSLFSLFFFLCFHTFTASQPILIDSCDAYFHDAYDKYILLTKNIETSSDFMCLTIIGGGNITLDGNGNTVRCNYTDTCWRGIYVSSAYNITIKNFVLEGWSVFIEIEDVANITVENNTLQYGAIIDDTGLYGIYVHGSSDFVVKNNTLRELSLCSDMEYYVYGICIENSSGTASIVNNTISDFQPCTTASVYALKVYSSSIYGSNIEDNILSNAYAYTVVGYYLESSDNLILKKNAISDLQGYVVCGIQIVGCHNITFESGSILGLSGIEGYDDSIYSIYINDDYVTEDVLLLYSTIDARSEPADALCVVNSKKVTVGRMPCEELLFYSSVASICRPAVAPCDQTEYYYSNLTCPPDGFKSSSEVCRRFEGCLQADYCSGNNVNCSFNANTPLQCSCGDGMCNFAENCSVCYADCRYSTCENIICPGTPPCSGQGQCVYGVCECDNPWSGIACSVNTVSVSVTPSAFRPTVEINIPGNSSVSPKTMIVSVASIVEFNVNSEMKRADFADMTFDVTQQRDELSASQSWQYTQILFGKAKVIVNITYYEASATVYFGNDTINIPPQTVKFNISISDWPFQDQLNVLQIAMNCDGDFLVDSDDKYCAEMQQIGGNLVWNKLYLDNNFQFYGQFRRLARVINPGEYYGDRDIHVGSNQRASEVYLASQYFKHATEFYTTYSVLKGDVASNLSIKQVNESCYSTFVPVPDNLSRFNLIFSVSFFSGSVAVVIIASIALLFLKKHRNHKEKAIRDIMFAEMRRLHAYYASDQSRMRILFAESNPPGTAPTFAGMALRELEEVVYPYYNPATTWSSLQQRVEQIKPTILHIWAHGEEGDGDKVGIVLSDNDKLSIEVQRKMDNFLIFPNQLVELIQTAKIEFLLLSVCSSAKFVEEAYLYSTCKCVGFNGFVNPRYMARWCVGFYTGMAAEKSFYECIEDGFSYLTANPVRKDKKAEETEYNKFKNSMVIRPLRVQQEIPL